MMLKKSRNSLINFDASTLFDLCSQGDLTELDKYLNPWSASEISSIRDEHDATLVHYAARYGQEHILRYFVEEKHLKVQELYTINGATCAHDAAVCDQVAALDYLLNHTSTDGNQGNYSTKKFSWTVQDDKGNSLLHLAAGYGSLNVLHYLLNDHGANSDVQSNNGFRPIHCACLGGHYESVKILLSSAPKIVNRQSKALLTPAYLACQNGSIDIVQLLASYGANFQLRDENGASCLHAACLNCHMHIVKWLIESKNAMVNEVDYTNSNALHYTASVGDQAILDYLLNNNAQMSIASNGNTPLHVAAQYGQYEIAMVLIERGHCSVTARNSSDLTAIDLAENSGFPILSSELRNRMKLSTTEDTQIYKSSLNQIQLNNATVVRLVVKKRNVQKSDVVTQVDEVELDNYQSNPIPNQPELNKSSIKTLTNRRFDVTELRARVEAYESIRNDSTLNNSQVDDVLMHSVASLNQQRKNRPRSKLPPQTYAPWLKMSNQTPEAFHEEIKQVSSNLRKVRRDSLLNVDDRNVNEDGEKSRRSRSIDDTKFADAENDSSSSSSASNKSMHQDSYQQFRRPSLSSSKVNPVSKSHQFVQLSTANNTHTEIPLWKRDLIERRRRGSFNNANQ